MRSPPAPLNPFPCLDLSRFFSGYFGEQAPRHHILCRSPVKSFLFTLLSFLSFSLFSLCSLSVLSVLSVLSLFSLFSRFSRFSLFSHYILLFSCFSPHFTLDSFLVAHGARDGPADTQSHECPSKSAVRHGAMKQSLFPNRGKGMKG